MRKYLGIILSLYSVFFFSAQVHGACPVNYEEIMGSCFLYLDVAADYLDAGVICQNFGGSLAVVNDCYVLRALSYYISGFGSTMSQVWIGATDVVTQGLWEWHDGSYVQMGAPFWGRVDLASTVLEPSGGAAENCAMIASGAGFYFQDTSCSNSAGMAPLCQIAPVEGSCPPPYVNLGNTCFQFLHTIDETWDDARTVCQSSLGDLAVLSDCVLMAVVNNYIRSAGLIPATGYWIGGTDYSVEGTWMWINGQTMDTGVPYFGRNGTGSLEPDTAAVDEHCLSMMGADRFLFNALPCSSVEKFLCQTAPI